MAQNSRGGIIHLVGAGSIQGFGGQNFAHLIKLPQFYLCLGSFSFLLLCVVRGWGVVHVGAGGQPQLVSLFGDGLSLA